ncbi:HNH endonuclease [Beutenbergia cavernae DSM 12333]|uniref:HNH endonuclease n=1 Tax=Beutenbergia cavernae (strain ATCC BAA-8 / DSM 12333 / CCUG 43141 / JCM 11478 / NBRC 16432 / NCIMB 13614 / HKI 0122) TaxID=471853 RepID=C5BXD2_BEUC1|nr:DUF222 domain-containing protein [Beutenbergia cavernae]ACQ80815.1 HNH endonuclease [Beutenbergia cavernae DSM 12333]
MFGPLERRHGALVPDSPLRARIDLLRLDSPVAMGALAVAVVIEAGALLSGTADICPGCAAEPSAAGPPQGPATVGVATTTPATTPVARARDVELVSAAVTAGSTAVGLAGMDWTRLGVEDLLTVIAEWRRVEAAAAAQVRYAAAELAGRAEMNPALLALHGADACIAPDELATLLGVSLRAARHLVGAGQQFTGPLADVGHALAAGLIDAGKAQVYCDVLTGLPVEVVLAVVDATLPHAPSWTHYRLKEKLRSAVVAASGADARVAHEHAAAGRHLRRPEPLPDGMARLVAVLPALDAQTVWTACDAAAWSARTSGDPRTLDQLRADALSLLAEHALATGAIGAPVEGGESRGDPDVGASPDTPAHAPSPLSTGSTAPPSSAPPPTTTDSASPDDRPTDPSCSSASPPSGVGAGVRSGVPGGLPVVRLGRPGRARPAVQVVIAASTILGLDDHPATLTGYGAIDAATARRFALGEDATWRRLLTDPATGLIVDVSAEAYRPSDPVARFVRARDPHSVVPGCGVPSDRCDLDHVIRFPWGPTTIENLAPLCRRHHLLKTHCGYTLTRHADGSTTWTTPFRHTTTAPAELPLTPAAPTDAGPDGPRHTDDPDSAGGPGPDRPDDGPGNGGPGDIGPPPF